MMSAVLTTNYYYRLGSRKMNLLKEVLIVTLAILIKLSVAVPINSRHSVEAEDGKCRLITKASKFK